MRLFLVAGFMLPAACHDTAGDVDRISRGDRAPSSLTAASDQVVVGWIVRETDCLACVTPAYEFRRLLENSGRVHIRTVVVGGSDSLVVSFLARERLPVDVRTISDELLRDQFGELDPPFIVVTHERVVRAVIRTASQPGALSSFRLDSILSATVSHR
jgi:hypothetical protein